jgi:hypothetical protein
LQEYVNKLLSERTETDNLSAKRELERGVARSGELDKIIKLLFEQNALGTVSDDRFLTLLGEYETEQRDLKSRIDGLRESLNKKKSCNEGAEQFYAIIRKYTEITELTAPILNELIDHIVVHNAVGRYKDRTQKIEIFYRFVGAVEY